MSIETTRSSRRTCEEKEGEDHYDGVAEVEERADEAFDVQLADVVVHAVEEEVDGSEAAGQEGAPPPVVVLKTIVARHSGSASDSGWVRKGTKNWNITSAHK